MIEGRDGFLERHVHSDIRRDVDGDDPERHLHVEVDVLSPLAAKVELDVAHSRIHPDVLCVRVREAFSPETGGAQRDLEDAHSRRVERVEAQLGITRAGLDVQLGDSEPGEIEI